MKKRNFFITLGISLLVFLTGINVFASGLISWGGEENLNRVSEVLTFLDNKLVNTKQKVMDLSKTNIENLDKIARLEKDVMVLRKEMTDLSNSKQSELAEKDSQIIEKINEINQKTQEKNEAVEAQQSKVNQLQGKNDELQRQLDAKQIIIDEKLAEITNLQNQIESRKNKISELESELSTSKQATKVSDEKLKKAIEDSETIKLKAEALFSKYNE